LVLAMAEPDEHRAFRLAWSVWRRAHQAGAARCAVARRARRFTRSRAPDRPVPPEPPQDGLTNAEWMAVQPLLPPQRPPTGRPRHDHRRVLGGILWVVRTQSSWRDLPPEFGRWETAYKRYRLWHDTDLWSQIISALSRETDAQSTEVAL
jgi:transposase